MRDQTHIFAIEWLDSTTWSAEQTQGTMPEASEPSAVAQIGQQGQELLARSQIMVADYLRQYLGKFQVGVPGGGLHACIPCSGHNEQPVHAEHAARCAHCLGKAMCTLHGLAKRHEGAYCPDPHIFTNGCMRAVSVLQRL